MQPQPENQQNFIRLYTVKPFDTGTTCPYYCALMIIGQLPGAFDPRKLARRGVQFEGSLALEQFGQLVDSLADDKGEVQVSLHFYMSEDHRVILEGFVSATLPLICQRCLGVAAIPVTADLRLMGVLTDEQARALPEAFDPMMMGDEPVELVPLLEEELLLALPIVASHPPEDCPAQSSYTTETEKEAKAFAEQVEKKRKSSNPFSVLAELKTHTMT